MARKRLQAPRAGPRPLAALTVARGRADARLGSRIAEGEGIRERWERAPFGDDGPIDDYRQWDRFNVDMLLRMFSDLSVADEYRSAGPAPTGSLDFFQFPERPRSASDEVRPRLEAQLRMLRALRERLDLHGEEGSGSGT
jgi:hypothetical protein